MHDRPAAIDNPLQQGLKLAAIFSKDGKRDEAAIDNPLQQGLKQGDRRIRRSVVQSCRNRQSTTTGIETTGVGEGQSYSSSPQ